MLALGKKLRFWQPLAVALVQKAERERLEKPIQTQEPAWSKPLPPALPDSASHDGMTVKLVVTHMATNQQTYLVLDMDGRYRVELSVSG